LKWSDFEPIVSGIESGSVLLWSGLVSETLLVRLYMWSSTKVNV